MFFLKKNRKNESTENILKESLYTLYYEEYPQRQPKTGEIQWDSDENGAYRRTNKKIGRNDPCPCGSGKKYKNCCGR